MDVSENVEVPDWAEVCLFGLRNERVDGVVVEGDFLHTELHFAGFDLDTCLGTCDDKYSKQDVQLIDVVSTSSEVVAVGAVLVANVVAQAPAILVSGVEFSVSAVDMVVQRFEVAGLLDGTARFGAHEQPDPAVDAVWCV